MKEKEKNEVEWLEGLDEVTYPVVKDLLQTIESLINKKLDVNSFALAFGAIYFDGEDELKDDLPTNIYTIFENIIENITKLNKKQITDTQFIKNVSICYEKLI